MKPTTKQLIEDGLNSVLYAIFYSILLTTALQAIFAGIDISIKYLEDILIGCWMFFILFEIIWSRIKFEIVKLVINIHQSK